MNILVLIIALLIVVPNTHAVSLSSKGTDESVCDLTPSTSYNLSKNVMFIEAGTTDEAEIYTRIALKFISTRCRDGQVLMMHSDFGDALDDRFFRSVAGQVCTMAQIQRESTATDEAPASFQLRCPISRIKEATAFLAAIERRRTTEAMIAEGAPRHRSGDSVESVPKKDCKGKLSFGQVILGMGGRCTE